MAVRPTEDSFIISVTMISSGERLMTTIPLACQAALVFDDGKKILDAFEAPGVMGKLCDCLAVDSYVSGIAVDGMVKGKLVPNYRVFGPAEYPGTIAGQSCPPQASVLMAWYSFAQLDDASNRVKSARNFLCPPPESKSNGRVLDNTYAQVAVGTFANLFLSDLFLISAGKGCTRVMHVDRTPAHSVLLCDRSEIRGTSFTQRRRESPVL